MDFTEIMVNIDDGVYSKEVEAPTRIFLNASYVFDVEKSVKWNRDQVAKNNMAYQAQVDAYDAGRAAITEAFRQDMITAIIEVGSFNFKQADAIYKYARESTDLMKPAVAKAASLVSVIRKVISLGACVTF